jgi:hypothetical protein
VTDNLSAFIGAVHCFSIGFAGAVSLRPVLKFRKTLHALNCANGIIRRLSGESITGRFWPTFSAHAAITGFQDSTPASK